MVSNNIPKREGPVEKIVLDGLDTLVDGVDEIKSETSGFIQNYIKAPVSRLVNKIPPNPKGILYVTGGVLVAFMAGAPFWYNDVISRSEKKACYSLRDSKGIDSCLYNLNQKNKKNTLDAELMLGSIGLVIGGTYAIYSSLPKKK